MSTRDIPERIINVITEQSYRPQEIRELADLIGIGEREYGEYRDAVKALHRAGRVVIGAGDMIMLPAPSGKIIGTYRANPRGFGFVIPESPTAHGDLFVPPGKHLTAVTGDTVLAKVLKKGKRGDKMIYEGRIVKILERGNSRIVGRLQQAGGRWFVWPDGQALHVPIFISDAKAKHAKVDAQVVVEIIQYPDADTEAQGVIVELLGTCGDPGVDTLSIIYQHHLPREFPAACLDEARSAAQLYDSGVDLAGRNDLRNEMIVTIDPDDARDFDDAISLTHHNGEWELGVHIADVSHFVQPKSVLDQEAYQRGNSVYFPGFVIPMLPESLSNGVCSLQEGVPRLAKSAFVSYDNEGNVISQRFSNSVIQSCKRLTYAQATLILEGKTGGYPVEAIKLLKDMGRLARIIQKRRRDEGMITLELPDVELILDEDGQVIGVAPEDQSFSHTLIEMFMIEANEAVARLFTGLDVPHLRRIHPDPEDRRTGNLTSFLDVLGHRLPQSYDRFHIQRVLESVKGKPESFSVNLAILRTMQPAEYSPQMLGHFALASKHYSHFTSPIRRYPDLIVHRLLDLYLRGELETLSQRQNVPDKAELLELGGHCSFTERRAEDAERELKLVKILRLLSDCVGDSFEGVVTGVTSFGIFVQLDHYLVDGLIRLETLSDDWWEVLPQSGCIVGERTGRKITIGDRLKVTLAKINIPARQLDLSLIKQLTSRKRTKATPRKKSKSTKTRAPKKKGRKRSKRRSR